MEFLRNLFGPHKHKWVETVYELPNYSYTRIYGCKCGAVAKPTKHGPRRIAHLSLLDYLGEFDQPVLVGA